MTSDLDMPGYKVKEYCLINIIISFSKETKTSFFMEQNRSQRKYVFKHVKDIKITVA